MRRIRYNCAASLDGYIAGPNDEFDWIPMDPEIDFQELVDQFDTYLLGRRTYELTVGHGTPLYSGSRTFVFSRTLSNNDYKDVTIVGVNWKGVVQALRKEPGKDIWLFGGGSLFRSLCEEELVDTVEVSIVPVLLGRGVPLVAGLSAQVELTLTEHRVYEKTGIVSLVYDVKKSRQDRTL